MARKTRKTVEIKKELFMVLQEIKNFSWDIKPYESNYLQSIRMTHECTMKVQEWQKIIRENI